MAQQLPKLTPEKAQQYWEELDQLKWSIQTLERKIAVLRESNNTNELKKINNFHKVLTRPRDDILFERDWKNLILVRDTINKMFANEKLKAAQNMGSPFTTTPAALHLDSAANLNEGTPAAVASPFVGSPAGQAIPMPTHTHGQQWFESPAAVQQVNNAAPETDMNEPGGAPAPEWVAHLRKEIAMTRLSETPIFARLEQTSSNSAQVVLSVNKQILPLIPDIHLTVLPDYPAVAPLLQTQPNMTVSFSTSPFLRAVESNLLRNLCQQKSPFTVSQVIDVLTWAVLDACEANPSIPVAFD